MARLVSDLKARITANLSGVDLNNVDDVNGAIEQGALEFIQKGKPPEAEGRQNLNLYAGVFDYPFSGSAFGTGVKDLKPQGITRRPWDTVQKKYADSFDRNKQNWWISGTQIAFEYRNGAPIIRIANQNTIQQLIFDTMGSITGWVKSGVASAPIQDTAIYYQQPASLRFNASAAGAASMTKTIAPGLDLTAYVGVAMAFVPVYTSDATKITNYILEIGSDAANYYQVTVTNGFLGPMTSGEFLLVGFDLSTAIQVGNPVITNMNYVQVSVTMTAAQNNIRFGGVWISLPYQSTLLFSTSSIFVPKGSVIPQNTISADTDTIALNDAGYQILIWESCIAVALQAGGSLGDPVVALMSDKLNGARARNGKIVQMGLYDFYRGDNPNEELRTAGNYYL